MTREKLDIIKLRHPELSTIDDIINFLLETYELKYGVDLDDLLSNLKQNLPE